MENCYLRGSKIRMVIVPDMLKNAPMFKKIDPRTKSVLAGGGGKKCFFSFRRESHAHTHT